MWLVLAALLVASLGAVTLVTASQESLRPLTLLKRETELRWTAHAVAASFGNRLKMEPWGRRFYRREDVNKDYSVTSVYRDREYTLWARDSVRRGVVETGTVDVFVRVADTDFTLGFYQRLRVRPAVATNPRVLQVLREMTIRDDFQFDTVRDDLLLRIEAVEVADRANRPSAEVSAREADVLSERDASVEKVLGAIRAAHDEVEAETRFAGMMERARARLAAGWLLEGRDVLAQAVDLAAGSNPVHLPQRLMTSQLALGKLEYALGLLSNEPARASFLDGAATKLAALVDDPRTSCVAPTAANLLAHVRMAAAALKDPLARDRARSRARDELRRNSKGGVFEDGSIEIGDLPGHFERVWSTSLAYVDCAFDPADPSQHAETVALASDDGRTSQPLTRPGVYDTLFWMPGGTALMLVDRTDAAALTHPIQLVDRNGTALATFEGFGQYATVESSGYWLTPRTNHLLFRGMAKGETKPSYWAQDLKEGRLDRIVGPEDRLGRVDHDPLRFSGDGQWVAYYEPPEGVKVAPIDRFLSGARDGRTVWKVSNPDNPPGFYWAGGAGLTRLVLYAEEQDRSHPERGRLLVVDPATGDTARSPAFPDGLAPWIAFAHQDRARIALLDRKTTRYALIDFGASGFKGPFELGQVGSSSPCTSRPARTGNLVFLSDASEAGGGIWRWDLDRPGDVRLLSLVPVIAPYPSHRMINPIAF